MRDMLFEIRLEGGKIFHIGRVEGEVGKATILHEPAFCRRPPLEKNFNDLAHATWHIRSARRGELAALLDRPNLCAPPQLTETTRGLAFVYVLESSIRDDTRIDVHLLDDDSGGPKPSTYEDWLAILREVKDDLNREALLRLRLPAPPASYEGFDQAQVLATTDLELHVRPRAIQWREED